MKDSLLQAVRGPVRRLGWGLADQVLSSLSNFGVGIVVAREVSPREFGEFAIAFSLYTLVIGVTRAIATDCLVVRFSGAEPAATMAAAKRATGLALCAGAVAGVVLVAAGLVAGHGFSGLLLALGVTMPGLLLQDAWRNVFFARARGLSAFLNDAVWTLLLVPAFLVVAWLAHPTAASLTLAWGLAACVAAAVGVVQARVRPDPRQARAWLTENRPLWPRYLAESVLFSGTQQVYFFGIGLIGGLVVVGQIKLVQIALGPVNIVIQGIGLVAVPEAVRAMRRSLHRLDVVVVAISALIAGCAAAWGVILGFAPRSWTSAFVGRSWQAASALLVPMSLVQVTNGANTGAFVGLRAFQAARRSLTVRAVTSAAQLVGALVGVSLAGAKGAAYGLFFASVGYLVAWWLAYARERSRQLRALRARPDSSARAGSGTAGDVAFLVDSP